MSFFAKIKQFFGAGTVKVTLNAPATFNTNDGVIEGSVHLEAKSDQSILSLEIVLKEEYSTGRGDDKTTKTYELGKLKLGGFDMKTGETKDVPFKLNYSYAKSDNESLGEKGGVMGGIGKLGSFASGEKSEFKLWATADVKGAALDPNDVKELKRAK